MGEPVCPVRRALCALCGARQEATACELERWGWDWWTLATGRRVEVCPECVRRRGGECDRLREGLSRR